MNRPRRSKVDVPAIVLIAATVVVHRYSAASDPINENQKQQKTPNSGPSDISDPIKEILTDVFGS
jgi:hypothetical protein